MDGQNNQSLAVLLALGSAAAYGAADFLGGVAARRTNTVAVVLVAQFAGLAALAAMISLFPVASPATGDLVWGVAAGIAAGSGAALLYRGLAVGSMAIVAPTTAVCAVILPMATAVVLGERLTLRVFTGIALAILSIVLVSQQRTVTLPVEPGKLGLPAGIGLALLSGVAFGVFFFSMARVPATAGLWPLLLARSAAVALFGIFAIVGRRSLRMATSVAIVAVACGVTDMIANGLYLFATHHGPLSLVVTLASLYPAGTVVLALAVLGERLNPLQGIGIGCALIAVLLIIG